MRPNQILTCLPKIYDIIASTRTCATEWQTHGCCVDSTSTTIPRHIRVAVDLTTTQQRSLRRDGRRTRQRPDITRPPHVNTGSPLPWKTDTYISTTVCNKHQNRSWRLPWWHQLTICMVHKMTILLHTSLNKRVMWTVDYSPSRTWRHCVTDKIQTDSVCNKVRCVTTCWNVLKVNNFHLSQPPRNVQGMLRQDIISNKTMDWLSFISDIIYMFFFFRQIMCRMYCIYCITPNRYLLLIIRHGGWYL